MAVKIVQAAQNLVRAIGAPPQAHSVWVRTITHEDKSTSQEICVSVRKQWEKRIKVPEMQNGWPVVRVPWPKEGEVW